MAADMPVGGIRDRYMGFATMHNRKVVRKAQPVALAVPEPLLPGCGADR